MPAGVESVSDMACRRSCGACCIAPSIVQPYHGMPNGKAAGLACVHLNAQSNCDLFDDPRRPACCAEFLSESAVCGESREDALQTLQWLERATGTAAAVQVTT